MDLRTRLASKLASEAEAYGYTLTVWGAGALLIDALGLPSVLQVLAYVGGALAGFGALAAVAFSGLVTDRATVEESESPLVVSTIHVVATGGSVLFAYGLLQVAAEVLPTWAVFAIVGAGITVGYNVALLGEEFATLRVT